MENANTKSSILERQLGDLKMALSLMISNNKRFTSNLVRIAGSLPDKVCDEDPKPIPPVTSLLGECEVVVTEITTQVKNYEELLARFEAVI